jgi:heme oxygenase (biliverdin-producing, ferredoxin)
VSAAAPTDPTTARAVPGEGFAAALRAATRSAHAEAENATFVTELLAGQLDLTSYARLVTQHVAIYTALERAVEAQRTDARVGAIAAPELARTARLVDDLTWLRGRVADTEATEQILPATAAYTTRIDEVGRAWPGGVLAHHYTRYLGDLSGGIQIGRVLQRRFGGGTSFYEFPAIADVRGFKQRYRATLDALPLDTDERTAVTAEVTVAYAHNRAVFADLTAACGGQR